MRDECVIIKNNYHSQNTIHVEQKFSSPPTVLHCTLKSENSGRIVSQNYVSVAVLLLYHNYVMNWLFNDMPKGVEASAIVYTMFEMVRVHDLNIYKLLNYLLENLPSTKMTDTALAKRTPWDQNVIANCSGTI